MSKENHNETNNSYIWRGADYVSSAAKGFYRYLLFTLHKTMRHYFLNLIDKETEA